MGVRGGVALAKEVMRMFRGHDTMPEVVLCPSFLGITELQKVLTRSRVKMGAQDAFWENEGAHTGSIGSLTLKEAGCTYVILGHSERRTALGETDEMIAKKIKTAFATGLKVILCVGDDLATLEAGQSKTFVSEELHRALTGVHVSTGQLLVAYEPLYAISGFGGHAEDVGGVTEMLTFIRAELQSLLGVEGAHVPLLYGGSVDGDNAYTFLREDVIDGVLVGSASVKVHQMQEIIQSALKAMQVL